jgi:hypothetical protein
VCPAIALEYGTLARGSYLSVPLGVGVAITPAADAALGLILFAFPHYLYTRYSLDPFILVRRRIRHVFDGGTVLAAVRVRQRGTNGLRQRRGPARGLDA